MNRWFSMSEEENPKEEPAEEEPVEEEAGKSNKKSWFKAVLILKIFKFLIFVCVILSVIWGVLYVKDNFEFGNLITGPEEDNGDFQLESEYVQDLNVRLVDFESPGSPYSSGDPILIRGYVEADTLEEDINLMLSCELSNYNGTVNINPGSLEIPMNSEEFRRSLSCSFENGIITDKRKKTEVAEIVARFDALSSSKYDVFVLSSQEYQSIEKPFSEYNLNPVNLGSGNRMKNEILESGPVIIDMFIDESQPFKEGEEYLPLEVKIKDVSEAGYIDNVQNLVLKLSSNIELSQDENFCDFEFISVDENGYNLYDLKQEIINDKINEKCEGDSLRHLRMNEKRCAEEFKKEISFRCDFITRDLQGYESFVQNVIIAEIDYTFEVRNSLSVDIENY